MSGAQADAVKPAPPPVPFSYAQAARGGGGASNPASTQSSKSPSGVITPAKEQGGVPSLKSELNGARWADSIDDEVKESSNSSASTAVDGPSISGAKSPAAHAATHVNGTASPASADFGGSSTSTLVRDDGPSPSVEMPESAWELKSQGAGASKAEQSRSRGSADRASSRGRKKGSKKGEKKERVDSEPASAATAKPTWTAPVKYVDAPAPAVNPWLARAQQTKAPAVPKPAPTPSPAATSTNDVKAEPVESTKPAAPVASTPSEPATSQTRNDSAVSSTARTPADENATSVPQKSRKASEKAEDATKPAVDAVAWPTPDTAPVDESKKRPQDKVEGDAQSTHEVKGKQAWNKLDFTPTVLFTTPIPGASRRGGKGGGRGGKGEGSTRTSVSGSSERRSESNTGAHSGEGGRRERSDANRSTSPNRAKRNAATAADENAARRSSRQESSTREAPAKATEETKSKASENAEQASSKSSSVLKPRANRKDDALVNGERNVQESGAGKENAAPTGHKNSNADNSAPQPASTSSEARKPETNATTNDRKPNGPADFPTRNHERKGSGSYSSFSSRGRGERGRGGHRGGRNNGHTFHPTAHSFVNGQGQFSGQNYNGTPKSPTGFGPDAFAGQAPQSNPRYGRNVPSRASSIPAEGTYPRFANGYPNQPLQLNTGVQPNGIYPQDYYLPATAIPFQNDPTSSLLNAVTQQMEYYFSIDNLLKDTFLRKHMDSQGFVLLTFIAEFKRLKNMTHDLELIKYVCQQSPVIEHRIGSDGLDRLRTAKGWKQWVLPKEDRDPSSQHDGPDTLHQPPRPHPQFLEQPHMLRHSSLPIPQSAGPVLGGQGFQSLNSFAAPYNYAPSGNLSTDSPAFNPMQTSPTSMTSGQNLAQPSNTSFGLAPAHAQFFPNGIEETEPDTFTDAEVDALKVVLRDIPGETGGSSRAASSRTFSNGSVEGVNGLLIATQSPPPEAAGPANDSEKPTSPTGSDRVNRFLASSSRLTSPRNASRNGESPASGSNGVYYIKDKDSPSYDSPTDTTSELYLHARDRALQQRSFHPCPHDMVIMYNFWEHFLVRNFNARMYLEFRSFAMEDASSRNEFKGLNSLLKYFGKALTSLQDAPIRRSVAQDYVNLVRSEPRESDRPAFKQLRAAWRDGALNMKNRKRVKDFLPPELEEELDR